MSNEIQTKFPGEFLEMSDELNETFQKNPEEFLRELPEQFRNKFYEKLLKPHPEEYLENPSPMFLRKFPEGKMCPKTLPDALADA